MEDFLPPVDNYFAVSIAKLLLPVAKIKQSLEFRVTPECKQLIKMYAPRNTVLMFNHSDRMDPLCAYELARVCGEEFYFLASREQFDKQFGLAGRVMQILGTYSVIRGKKIDEPSAMTTISILVEGKRNLVEFPEGDVTGRNDQILPLKEDGIRNMFAAQKRLLSGGNSLFLLPVALYYQVVGAFQKPMNDTIARLEKALGVMQPMTPGATLESKIKNLVSLLIDALASYYGLRLAQDKSLSAQLRQLSRSITIVTAMANGIDYNADDSEVIMLFGVRADLRKQRDYCSNADTTCGFNAKLKKVGQKKRQLFTKDLDRAEQLLILASTLENQDFTPEIAWRVLDRLDLEITGQSKFKGSRIAWINASEPVDLQPLYAEFLVDEKSAIDKVNQLVRASLDDLMRVMQEKNLQLATERLANYK